MRPGVNPKLLEAKLKVEFHNWLASHVPDMEPGEKQLWQQQTLHLTPGGAGVAAMRDQYQDGLGYCWWLQGVCCWWPAGTWRI